jgi:esterase/lipase superfamily enzyme
MRIRLAAMLFSFALFFCLFSPGVRAQVADGAWVVLETAIVSQSGSQTVTVSAANPRASSVMLSAKGGTINLARVIVNYGNGQTHYEDRVLSIRAGERTRPLAERAEQLAVESVALEIRSVASAGDGPVAIEIWGLQTKPKLTIRQRGESEDNDASVVAQKRGYYEVPVFYGTTRKQEGEKIKNNRVLAKFGNSQTDTIDLTLGRALVTVPYDRPIGSIPRPEIDLLVTSVAFRNEDPARDFTIAESRVLTSSQFVEDMKKQMSEANRFKDQAFVFVHGYNVSFDDAVFRTAQIAKDIGFDGPAVAFSWRSNGGMWSYRHDIDTAKESRIALRELLTILARDSGVGAINLVAHSMGNDPVIEVLRENAEIKRGGGSPQDFRLNEVVLAAPDVARTVFAQFAATFAPVTKSGITLYASSRDRMLIASKRVASGIVRAGDIPREGILVVPGVESIDISNASTEVFSTNHDTFADRQHLIDDMGLLFERRSNKHPPSVRFPVYKVQGRSPAQWWQYRQ